MIFLIIFVNDHDILKTFILHFCFSYYINGFNIVAFEEKLQNIQQLAVLAEILYKPNFK